MEYDNTVQEILTEVTWLEEKVKCNMPRAAHDNTFFSQRAHYFAVKHALASQTKETGADSWWYSTHILFYIIR